MHSNSSAGQTMDSIIEVRDLVKKFDGRAVLNGVNVGIPRGKITVIMGWPDWRKPSMLG